MIQRAFGLTTDLYELTMAAAYFDSHIKDNAIFELFIRRLPRNRSFLITAGLEQALNYLSSLRFTAPQIDYLRNHPSFGNVSSEFFDYLAEFRFTGDVWAMPEGTTVFAMEPILRVTAPIIEAQIIETFLLSTINFQTMIASKAARVVTAARGRSIIEFGTRRAHGTEAGLFAARAAYIGGCIGTSNVEAGYLFGIPTYGTLAHSFVMSFDDEDEAFRAFMKVFPKTATVLVDTYDTIAAVERLARDFGSAIPSVRLDSGDLLELSIQVRRILDQAGMSDTKIFASSDLNEHRIADLIARGAQIDSFGVGTELATSYDSPALSAVYKLVALEQSGRIQMRIKLSEGKATYPGAKQVWRFTDTAGKYAQDIVAFSDEAAPENDTESLHGSWQPLLVQVMKDGRAISDSFASGDDEVTIEKERQARLARLNKARDRAADKLKRLPDELVALDCEANYPVIFSNRLREEQERLKKELGG
jgi:putative nicotinate phosphoribosyltransferase